MRLNFNTLILALCTATGLRANDSPSNVATPKQAAEQLLTVARSTRTASLDLMAQMKAKNADMSKVNGDVAAIEKSAAAIHSLLEVLESQRSQLTSKKQAELLNAKAISELLHIFLANKKDLASDGATPEERERIGANAGMVAQRDELLEKTVRRMGI